MIKHIVIFKWHDDVTEQQIAAVTDDLRALPGAIDALDRYLVAPDLGLTDGTADFAIVATVADTDALTSYLEHPRHVPLAARLRSMAASRSAVQVSVD